MDDLDIVDDMTGAAWVCLVVAALVWSSGRLFRAARSGLWRTPGWFWRTTWTSLYLAAGTWLWGLFSQAGIRDYEDVCRWDGQPYDAAYSDAHHAAKQPFFPLSDPCNANYDLVPACVNPACVVFTLAFVVSLGGAVATLLLRRRARYKHR